MNDWPIVLKPEDSAPAPDPQGTVIELAEMASELVKDAERVRDMMTRWRTDPTAACERAQPRLVELHQAAGRISDLVLELSRGYRAAGTFSAQFGRGG